MNRSLLASTVAWACLCSLAACAQTPSLPPLADREAALVATSTTFAFYSDFWLNLHDDLYRLANEEGTTEEDACLQALPEQTRDAWQAAATFYADDMGDRHHRLDSLMVAVRYRLAGVEDEIVSAVDQGAVLEVLKGAAPAYQACWWAAHDRRNRQWVADLLPRLEAYEDTVHARVARSYQVSWPTDRIPVDLVSYASWGGANTIAQPNHMMMSSENPKYKEFAALEMVFHEGSHTVLGAGYGEIPRHLAEASRPYGKDPPPNLLHAILFYTTGMVTAQILEESGQGPYTPYMYANGVFTDSHPILEAHWQPYLDHTVDLETAARNLIDAIFEE